MEHATASMDKRWFLDPTDSTFQKWVKGQDREFKIKMYEVHFPDILDKYHESKGADEAQVDEGPEVEELRKLLFTKPIEAEKTERQIMEEVRVKVATQYAQSMPYGRGNKIVEEVAEKYGISVRLLRSTARQSSLVAARREAVFRMREELGYSFPRIGDMIGGRDHTTAMHSYRKFVKAAESEIA